MVEYTEIPIRWWPSLKGLLYGIVLAERLLRTVECKEIYLLEYRRDSEASEVLTIYFYFYNKRVVA